MEKWKEILEEHEIPPEYYNCEFKEHPAIKHRWNEIISFAKHPEGNILMSGTCGTGKTMTSTAIMAAYTAFNGRGARFYDTETLYPEWLYEARSGCPGEFARRLIDSPLLILDDMGQGEISDSFKRWLYCIINKRSARKRSIVVTTNLIGAEFRNLFGDSILSRLSDGKIWKFKGKDYRIKNKEEIK